MIRAYPPEQTMSEEPPEPTAPLNADGVREPFNVEDVPWRTYGEGDRFGLRYRALGYYAGGSNVGVEIAELEPGRQSYPAHFHMLEEEHMLILDGSATLRLGDRTYTVSAGDYVCFPAGQKAGHAMVNHTDKTCRYLMIGESKGHEVVVYTDSNKVGVRVLGQRFPMGRTMDYWEDEGVAEPVLKD